MRPGQRLAVDILLEKTLAHHEAEIAPCAPPRGVRGFVDDVAQVVEAARIAGLASRQPLLARLSALPLPRRKAEDFDLHAAALQRPGENVREQAATMIGRPRIDPELSRRRVTRVSRKFVSRSRLKVSGWNRSVTTRESLSRVQNALVEIEVPRAVLLCEQAALQAICKPADGDMEDRKLLVEKAAQPFEFVGVAKRLGADEFVELARKDVITEILRRFEDGEVWTPGGA